MNQLIESLEGEQLKTNLPNFKVGDTVSIHYRIIEGTKEESKENNGKTGAKKASKSKESAKERVQIFTGTVIARKGKGISETISIYRIAYGSAMERVIPIHSPKVVKVEVVKEGSARKGKLYHLRGEFGKKAKIQERIGKRGQDAEVMDKSIAEDAGSQQENPSTEE